MAKTKTFSGSPRPSKTWYAIAETSDEAEVMIYDAIGAFGVTAAQFVADIGGIKANKIRVRLNTPGGEVFDGFAIYNALKEHPAEVDVYVDGLAASAGSVVAMSGDKVWVADNAFLMIHNASGGVYGGAEDMHRYGQLLEDINHKIAGVYAKRTGVDATYWAEQMGAETWYTAEEAVDEGLADGVFEAGDSSLPGPKSGFNFKVYNHVPERAIEVFMNAHDKINPQGGSQRSDLASAEHDKEQSVMADITTTAPPQAPADGGQNQSGADEKIALLNSQAIEAYIAKGKAIGAAEETKRQTERMRAIYELCPNDPALAINCFIAGQTPEVVKIAYDAAQAESQRAREAVKAKDLEIARLNALIANGGSVGVGFSASKSVDVPSGLEPEQQAKLEWASDAGIRAKYSEKQWMLYRTNQLSGNVGILTVNPR